MRPKKYANLSCDVDDCNETGFKSAAHLGRHKRFTHGILGKHAQAAIPTTALTKSNKKGAKANAIQTGIQDHPEFQEPFIGIILRTMGKVEGIIQEVAYQNDVPGKQLARGVAEHLLLQTGR